MTDPMTAPRDCRPPEDTPDGAMLWLRNDKEDSWCVVQWDARNRDGALLWWPVGGVKPIQLKRDGYRFHSIAEPPHE